MKCGSCGADLRPSTSFVWHHPHEDCRAVKDPQNGNVFEYQFGVFVRAKDEQEAWELVRPISEALDALDIEGQSAVEGPWDRTKEMNP